MAALCTQGSSVSGFLIPFEVSPTTDRGSTVVFIIEKVCISRPSNSDPVAQGSAEVTLFRLVTDKRSVRGHCDGNSLLFIISPPP